jgi:hypothetical protein
MVKDLPEVSITSSGIARGERPLIPILESKEMQKHQQTPPNKYIFQETLSFRGDDPRG